MFFNKFIKLRCALVVTLFLGACNYSSTSNNQQQQGEGDAYTGTETVKFLADGVPDRVFFSTNKFNLTTAAISNA